MKCCANCEWCISPDEEDEIIEEQSYNEQDYARPHAGDCALGISAKENFVCDKHEFKDDMEENIEDNDFTYIKYEQNSNFIKENPDKNLVKKLMK